MHSLSVTQFQLKIVVISNLFVTIPTKKQREFPIIITITEVEKLLLFPYQNNWFHELESSYRYNQGELYLFLFWHKDLRWYT